MDSEEKQNSDLPAGLSKPAQRALQRAGLLKLEQFSKVTEAEVLQLHGMGPKGIELIRRALAGEGKSFADGS
ncbi:DNA-binding protein [Paenibacillus lutrae]|uniref:DNA-binding protein n=1 Tax=Paenibacillus lutrae TaxID=2078573 RepID=A0A7X3JXY6_9BACL|nr:DNA-binding protein [Paenibacillus lutrae]MVO98389.1 DNA-binding protein [Paenibacillus lutrae]